jgi:hypothetical protein
MTRRRDFKALVRERMQKTGESYATALRHIANTPLETRPESTQTSAPLKGWFARGETPAAYAFERDLEGHGGQASAVIRASSAAAAATSADLMQHFLAENYRGRRLRFSGWIKSENVSGACSLWMRIDENINLLIFAHSSSLAGSNDWTQRQVVLDVDAEATLISIGVAIEGSGTAWISDIALEIVGADIPTTASRNIPLEPKNLNFSE